jgi:molybdate transport system substrate-binding protein
MRLIFYLALALAAGAARAGTVTVFAAASLADALAEAGRNYQAATGETVALNFAASSLLERQIEAGAPADIFFSADEAKMDALAARGLIVTNTRVSRLSNALVVIVPQDAAAAVAKPEDLARAEVRRIALADPQAVPAGIYAKGWLTKIGLWSAVEKKIVPTANVRAALATVESGDVDAGIVFKTDAAISKKVKVACTAPAGQTPPISYPMAMIKETKQPELARKFLEYLQGAEAGRVFEKYGFVAWPPRL